MTRRPEYSPDNCLQGLGLSLAFQLIVASRVVVGLGEGVALPSMNNLVATLPKSLRSTGLGVAFTGFHSGQCLPPIPFWHTMLVTGVLSCQKVWVWKSVVACREPAWAGYFSHHPCKVWVAWPLLHIWHPWGASLGFLAGNGTRQTHHRSDAA